MVFLVLYCFTEVFDSLAMFRFLAASLVFAVALDWFIGSRLDQNLIFRLLAFVGTISYSLYLWHQPLILKFYWHYQFLPYWLDWVLVVGSLVMLAFVSYQLVERTGMKLGSSLWKTINSKSGLGAQEKTKQPLEETSDVPHG